jgi:aspartate/tyrosine/aromatic aminotransferase
VIYFGDNAYKWLKEDIVEWYDFMKQLINDGVMAFHYTSFSKIGNYRWTPGYQNILAATPWERSNTGELRTILADIQKTDTKELLAGLTSIQRADGIWATADGAILMRKLIDNKDFQQEVRVLNQYLKYTRDTLKKELEWTQLEPYFSEKTNGIFRCVPSEVTKILNSWKKQAITVGDRINIWPLGDPKNREFFLEALK